MADSFPGDVTRYRTLVQVDKNIKISILAKQWPMSPATSLAQVTTPPNIPNQAWPPYPTTTAPYYQAQTT